jgi:LacI family transcriptional regulator
MKHSSNNVTVRDVAKLAAVSPATVSKVLNAKGYVSEESKARVLDAIEKLGFRPNTIARSLKKNSTLTIGLITDDLEGVFTMSMMRGVEEVASQQGFSVFLCNSYGQMEREKQHLEVLLAKQVEGVILLSGYRVRERSAPSLPLGSLPIVYLYQYTHDISVPCVIPDDRGGGYSAALHLIRAGRKRIGMLNGPPKYEVTHQRLQGYREALEEAGLPYDPGLVRVGKWHEQSGYQLARELMQLPLPPDAIFCASDSIAVGALDALHELRVKVPDDVALVGFDNRHFSQYQRPPLTTIALPLVEMGRLASQLILSAIRHDEPENIIHNVPCELIQRQSCGALPSQI